MSYDVSNKNIFKNATARLTLVYILIITAICMIFNLVILSTARLDDTELDFRSQPENSNLIPRNTDLTRRIIEARNRKTRERLVFSLYILDATILICGGFGSYWLAKKTLAPIEKSHKLQSQFISDASHELKTPLAAICLETEMILRENSPKKSEMKEVLESNLEEAKSLTSLTSMLLKLSQMDDSIKMETINLNEVVQNRLDKFPKADIKFSATKIFLAQANETVVDELVSILVDNALKYRTDKNPIEVNILRKNRQAVLEISNSSDEISKENLDKLFERFYREDKSRTRCSEIGGHGLGLSIAKKLVELVDASMSVRNEKFITDSEPNFKTTFSVGFHFSK